MTTPACEALVIKVRRSSTLRLRRRHGAGLRRDDTVVLDAAVAREIEHGLLAEGGGVKIARVHDEFVPLAFRLRDDLAVRIDDGAAADHGMAILITGLG